MELKKCTKCGLELPATLDFFYSAKHGKYSVRASCKKCDYECNKTNVIEWKKNNPEKRLEGNERRRLKYHTNAEERSTRLAYFRKYSEDGRRQIIRNKPENKKKATLRSKKEREELKPSYIAHLLRIPVDNLTDDVFKIHQLIVKIKRELNYGSEKRIEF